jgi:hypothetical protein
LRCTFRQLDLSWISKSVWRPFASEKISITQPTELPNDGF